MSDIVKTDYIYQDGMYKRYKVVGISLPVENDKLQDIHNENTRQSICKDKHFKALNKSNELYTLIYKNEEGNLYHGKEQGPEKLIIYEECGSNNPVLFLMSINDFISSKQEYMSAKNSEYVDIVCVVMILLLFLVVPIYLLFTI
ncbi:hypothetical protein [Clostridioides sp. ZZV15-6597]|uniref:hypothetical protein n=1 Tax=Clostridioides sp. ZZV15-6597 TaxID=2811500 RepID=UPI001D10563F|nr:hypothetical protein [Clostridioides sp. ZZV15-6597]